MLSHPHQLILILLLRIIYYYHYHHLHFIVKETGSEDQKLSIKKGHPLCRPDPSKPHGQSLQLATGPHPGSSSRASNPSPGDCSACLESQHHCSPPTNLKQTIFSFWPKCTLGPYPTLFHLLPPLILPSTALFQIQSSENLGKNIGH